MASALQNQRTLPVNVGDIKSDVVNVNVGERKAVKIIVLWSHDEIKCWELVINASIQLDA